MPMVVAKKGKGHNLDSRIKCNTNDSTIQLALHQVLRRLEFKPFSRAGIQQPGDVIQICLTVVTQFFSLW